MFKVGFYFFTPPENAHTCSTPVYSSSLSTSCQSLISNALRLQQECPCVKYQYDKRFVSHLATGELPLYPAPHRAPACSTPAYSSSIWTSCLILGANFWWSLRSSSRKLVTSMLSSHAKAMSSTLLRSRKCNGTDQTCRRLRSRSWGGGFLHTSDRDLNTINGPKEDPSLFWKFQERHAGSDAISGVASCGHQCTFSDVTSLKKAYWHAGAGHALSDV